MRAPRSGRRPVVSRSKNTTLAIRIGRSACGGIRGDLDSFGERREQRAFRQPRSCSRRPSQRPLKVDNPLQKRNINPHLAEDPPTPAPGAPRIVAQRGTEDRLLNAELSKRNENARRPDHVDGRHQSVRQRQNNLSGKQGTIHSAKGVRLPNPGASPGSPDSTLWSRRVQHAGLSPQPGRCNRSVGIPARWPLG